MSDIRIEPQPVAIVRVFSVIAAATVVVFILAWLLTGGGTEFFEPKSYLYSSMADASGLVVKARVQLDGMQIGKISNIRLSGLSDPKKVVQVEMKVKSRYLPAIPVDSTVTITADNLLGDRYLNITTGKRTEAVRDGWELRSVLPIGQQFNSADLVAAMKDILNRADASLREVEDARTPIGQFVQTEDFYNRARSELIGLQDAVAKIAHPKSDLGKMLFTSELYDQLRAPMVSIDKSLADIQAGDGQYGHMLESSEQYDAIRNTLRDFRESLANVNNGKGGMGEFMQSDQTYNRLRQFVDEIGRAADSVSSGEARVSLMLSDSQLYESLTGSTAEMRDFLGDFRRNPRKYLQLKVF